jgi:hypothetical protein
MKFGYIALAIWFVPKVSIIYARVEKFGPLYHPSDRVIVIFLLSISILRTDVTAEIHTLYSRK